MYCCEKLNFKRYNICICVNFYIYENLNKAEINRNAEEFSPD